MTGDASLLSNLIPYDGPRVTFGGSNDFGLTQGLGNLVYKGLTIQAVSYVEGLNYNLLSISQFCDKGYSLEFCKDMASLKKISTNEVILTEKRIRNIYEISEKMKVVGANVHFQKLEAMFSSPTFFQSYLQMIAAQELSEFLQMEIPLKFEEEVLEFYRNGEIKSAQPKKNPQRTFPVIKSTVGGTRVKLSQKKLGEKLRLPNSGVEVGKFPVKNLDWNIIGISGQAPSGPAKKAVLKTITSWFWNWSSLASSVEVEVMPMTSPRREPSSSTLSLPKLRSALAVASANQVVTKDYLKVIIDNQKEAFKLFRLIGANSGNRKMEVILQQHSPSPIPQLPIAIKEGEVSYIPSHLNLTNLILEAQQRNPENSAQLLSSSGLDGTEFIGTVVDHFSNDAQSEERRENLRRIKELCGNMKGISEVAGSSKRNRN
ncbi:unnamed protein product [Cuscuta campestris]|uniref:Uncharacterized protein n=1 Tax=Cuscuta campestris TaxID=132261 RepID=A0A484NAC4_9ASTE|nr:unnamed protein product [Cuscuta campestris]